MNYLFISDLHLEENRPDITQAFVHLLEEKSNKNNELYILGDLFDRWIGDDDHSPFHQSMINHLKKATTQGLAIYFIHGNRDFLIGDKFFAATGCQLLPEEKVIDLFGIPTLIMHGDTLCTEDKKYLLFRKIIQNPLFKKIIAWVPLEKRKALANQCRKASDKHTRSTPEYIMDVTQEAVAQIMKKYGVTKLIHGHTHRPAVHEFSLEGVPASRTVLGAWHKEGSVLVCSREGFETVILKYI